jgi:hypothetical protein
MPVIRQILLCLSSQLILNIGTAQPLDSISINNFHELTEFRSFSNKKPEVFTREEYNLQQNRGGPTSYYYTDVRNLFFRPDSTFEEVIQYPVLENLNSNSDLYSLKDTCYLKENFIAFTGIYSVLRDTIYFKYINLLVFDNLAYGYIDSYYSNSNKKLSISKHYISQYIICRFDKKRTEKLYRKNSELYDTSGTKWYGLK